MGWNDERTRIELGSYWDNSVFVVTLSANGTTEELYCDLQSTSLLLESWVDWAYNENGTFYVGNNYSSQADYQDLVELAKAMNRAVQDGYFDEIQALQRDFQFKANF